MKSVTESINVSDFITFAELSRKDLKILFIDLYQLSHAVSYLAKIITER